MPQMDEQKKAALQQRIAALKMKIKRIEKRESDTERRARNHRLIIAGAIVEDDTLARPDSEFARAYGRLLAQRVEANERPLFAELFRVLLPANEAEALLSGETTTVLSSAAE
jgi:hypothetical protein